MACDGAILYDYLQCLFENGSILDSATFSVAGQEHTFQLVTPGNVGAINGKVAPSVVFAPNGYLYLSAQGVVSDEGLLLTEQLGLPLTSQ